MINSNGGGGGANGRIIEGVKKGIRKRKSEMKRRPITDGESKKTKWKECKEKGEFEAKKGGRRIERKSKMPKKGKKKQKKKTY